MKIAIINMTHKGSTGKIMLQIADVARKKGYDVKTYSPMLFSRVKKQVPLIAENHYNWGNKFESAFHYYVGTLSGLNGFFTFYGTSQLIKNLKKFQPDIVHLHNLHNFNINLPLLFRYLKKSKVKVVWTLHDCWAFTGHCPYFTMAECDRWKNGCYNCTQLRLYPKSMLDTSKLMYGLKKKWFNGIADMVIVTPSVWLADLAGQSYLKGYPVTVINNGIDINIFKPTKNNFREQYNISDDKKILLGVALGWGKRKGIDVFIELNNRLEREKYQIVLVGTDDKSDSLLPENIISIHQTSNQQELAEIYSAADIFVNPTREENYPTVNMEAIACGTPVITFNTGGSPEIPDETCGSVVECDDIAAMEQEIIRICNTAPYAESDCIRKAKSFDSERCFEKYVKLYSSLKGCADTQ